LIELRKTIGEFLDRKNALIGWDQNIFKNPLD